jgi:hypothetical protein
VANVKNIIGRQPSAVNRRSQNWPHILWREWSTCEEQEYAQRLFDLVGHTRLGWGSTLVVALTATMYGLLVGYLFGLIITNWNIYTESWVFTETLSLALAWVVGIAGGLVGVLISRWISWRMWLNVLTPHIFAHKISELTQFNMALLVGFVANLVGLHILWSVGLGILIGVILLDVSQRGGISTNALTGTLNTGQRYELLAIALVSGLGALMGSVFAQGGWTSIVAGITIGAWLGVNWSGGPLGILVSWLGVLFGWVFGLDNWLLGWLSLGVGFGLGMIPNMVGRSINFADAYKRRPWYFWWRKQPPVYKVEIALQLAQAALSTASNVWAEPLHRLARQKEQPSHPELLIAALQSRSWVDRFVARQALVAIGGEATESLRNVAADRSNPLWQTAIWLLASIERETINRLAWRTPYILCPDCLTRFEARSVSVWWGVYFTYYGCRLCGQSRKFLDCPQGVVAVLDGGWTEEQSYQDNQIRVNWLTRRALFDFDRVEIVQATDEDVERFAVRAGNDTDPFRKPRYQQIPCRVKPECQLSENTMRILDRMFGQVEHGRED